MSLPGSERIPVRLDIQPTAFNQTIGLLAGLIAAGEVAVVFGDQDETSLHLNPARVIWFIDQSTQAHVPVVTKPNLLTYADSLPILSNQMPPTEKVERIFTAIQRRRQQLGNYLFTEGADVHGFLALRLPQLADRIAKGERVVSNLGPLRGAFLLEYCADMFIQPSKPPTTS